MHDANSGQDAPIDGIDSQPPERQSINAPADSTSTELIAYKPAKSKDVVSGDQVGDENRNLDIELGDYERSSFGSNYVEVASDNHIPVSENSL